MKYDLTKVISPAARSNRTTAPTAPGWSAGLCTPCRAYRFASCELLLLYPAPSRTLRSPGPLWTRLRAGRASPLFATRALTLPPSVPLIRRTLFTCGRVNPIAPSIAGRRREYQRSKRARLFRREYFKQSSSNFQIYLCKECPSRPAVSRSRNSKAHRRRISAVFSALLFIKFSKVRYPHRTFLPPGENIETNSLGSVAMSLERCRSLCLLAASFTLPPRSKRDAAKVPDVRNRSRYHHKTTAHS